ncbi:MAG: 2-phospho-L-lactate guanylyltransferase [Candidatus Hadarchaeales archaeon]
MTFVSTDVGDWYKNVSRIRYCSDLQDSTLVSLLELASGKIFLDDWMSARPWLIIPIKDLSLAKSSLQNCLNPEERKKLIMAMLTDVLTSAKRVQSLDRICVLSPNEEILKFASNLGIRTIREPGLSLNPALEFAISRAKAEGADSVLIIPGDVPLITPRDIREIISLAEEEKVVVISPSKDRGTNALLLKPPDVISLKFGGESFPVHLKEAFKTGAKVKIYHSESIAFDIDKPEDLLKVKIVAPHTRTADFLSSLEKDRILDNKV